MKFLSTGYQITQGCYVFHNKEEIWEFNSKYEVMNYWYIFIPKGNNPPKRIPTGTPIIYSSYLCLQIPQLLAIHTQLQLLERDLHTKVIRRLAYEIGKIGCFCFSPERTGWMQLRRMVNANNGASSFTIAITKVLEENIIARLSQRLRSSTKAKPKN